MTNNSIRKDIRPTWDTETIRNADIELRFKLRDEISDELAQSIGEHGVLTPPMVLELTPELQKFFNTEKCYLCIDGHSRLEEIPKEMEIECHVVKWDELVRQSQRAFQKAGMQSSEAAPEDVILTYILRLHACREPLPRSAYVDAAEKLLARGFSIRQVATLLGVPKTSLHRWMKKNEDITDEDLEASKPSTQVRKQCGLCGKWIRRGAKPIWFHPECHDKAVLLIEESKAVEDESLHHSTKTEKGGENGE
jgi:hypothetical protein